jgi:hypothetical protein
MSAFSAINGHANGLGHTNHGALCQEFLSGTEFVIDGVSRDGVYKVRHPITHPSLFSSYSLISSYHSHPCTTGGKLTNPLPIEPPSAVSYPITHPHPPYHPHLPSLPNRPIAAR